jgi:hypothetical protein
MGSHGRHLVGCPCAVRRLGVHQKPTPVGNLPLQGDNPIIRERRNLFRVVSPGHGRGLKHFLSSVVDVVDGRGRSFCGNRGGQTKGEMINAESGQASLVKFD